MTTFIFARHAKSQDNQDGLVSTPQTPLTKEGEAQARKAGRELRAEGITTILTSPYPRALSTAEIIAKELKLPPENIKVIDDLRERGLGHLEGHKHTHEHSWYFTTDGESDIEPRGMVIARCESALAAIKKASQAGKVLVISHTMYGYYLREVAAGKRRFEDFGPVRETANAGHVTITITDAPMAEGSKPLAWAFLAFVLGAILLVVGLSWLTARPRQSTEVKEQLIPLSAEDFSGDPQLQGFMQQLQQQSQTQQAGNDAGQLQPTTPSIPQDWQ